MRCNHSTPISNACATAAQWATLLVAAALLVGCPEDDGGGSPPPACGGEIRVTHFDDIGDGAEYCSDRSCTLRQAIRTAVACATPTEREQVIALDGTTPATGAYRVTEPLPEIVWPADVKIEGNGATIEFTGVRDYREANLLSSSSLTVRDVTMVELRLQSGGDLWLERVQLQRGTILVGEPWVEYLTFEIPHLVVVDSVIDGSGSSNRKGRGGAVENWGSARIVQSELRNNEALRRGGAIYNGPDAVLIVKDSILEGNRVVEEGGGGGAIYNASSSYASLKNTIVRDNSSVAVMSVYNRARGGAIQNRGELDVRECAFLRNQVFSERERSELPEQRLMDWNLDGGAIYTAEGTVTIEGSWFEGNYAERSGGAIFKESGLLDVYDTSFVGNRADYDGGALLLAAHPDVPDRSKIHGATFAGNVAVAKGGAIAVGNTWPYNPRPLEPVLSNLRLHRSTLSGNVAQVVGAGISVWRSRISVEDSTIAHNRLEYWDDAVWETEGAWLTERSNRPYGAAGLVLGGDDTAWFDAALVSNTIIAHNVPGDCFSRADGILELQKSLDSDGSCGFILSGVDPLLTPLADFGGPTDTHALRLNSPALDAGESCLEDDQRGFQRPADINARRCDIGAFEFQGVSDAFPELLDPCFINPEVCNLGSPGQVDDGRLFDSIAPELRF